MDGPQGHYIKYHMISLTCEKQAHRYREQIRTVGDTRGGSWGAGERSKEGSKVLKKGKYSLDITN